MFFIVCFIDMPFTWGIGVPYFFMYEYMFSLVGLRTCKLAMSYSRLMVDKKCKTTKNKEIVDFWSIIGGTRITGRCFFVENSSENFSGYGRFLFYILCAIFHKVDFGNASISHLDFSYEEVS